MGLLALGAPEAAIPPTAIPIRLGIDEVVTQFDPMD